MQFSKKPVTIEAHQWWKNGDHPEDKVGEWLDDPMGGPSYQRLEGDVVRFFRRPEPEYRGELVHVRCGRNWHSHGWIDTLEGGHTVCPADWIITGVQGERYPCKPDIFDATYVAAPEVDTLAAWLYHRFDEHKHSRRPKWTDLDSDDQAYWEHEANAVRRAVARGGFKSRECADTCAPHLFQFCSPECEAAAVAEKP